MAASASFAILRARSIDLGFNFLGVVAIKAKAPESYAFVSLDECFQAHFLKVCEHVV